MSSLPSPARAFTTARQEVWVITGASRGIGAELVHQVLERQDTIVIAGARRPEDAGSLQALQKAYKSRLVLLQLEVTDLHSVQAAVQTVRELASYRGVDYLVNNAGTAGSTGRARTEDSEVMKQTLDTNCIGTHRVTQAFLPLLQEGNKKTIVNVSAMLGSLTWGAAQIGAQGPFASMTPRMLGYKASKAAINMVTVTWAADLTPTEGFTVVSIHPGLVQTDMSNNVLSEIQNDSSQEGQSKASENTDAAAEGTDSNQAASPQPQVKTAQECAAEMIQTILQLKLADSGKLLNNDGTSLPY